MKLKLFLFIPLICLLFISATTVFNFVARADDKICQDVSDCEAKAQKYQDKIDSLKEQEDSLAKEIEYSDSQIAITQLRIQASLDKLAIEEAQIRQISGDIADLSVKIDKLGESIKYQDYVLKERLRARYKSMETSPLVIFLGSPTFNSIIQKTQYLKVMEYQDKKLLDEMNATKQAYAQQKTVFEDKKQKEEELRKKIETEKNNLVGYRATLEEQKAEKNKLLKDTQNDESKYQKLLDDAMRELQQIQGAANVVIRKGNNVEVDKGEVVGTMGSSGNSTGPHLHFGVYKYSVSDFQDHPAWSWYYSNYVNPLNMLKSKTVYWDTGCYRDPSGNAKSGKGSWDWPMSNVRITQNFGSNTCYNWMYGGNPHPAIDMVGTGDISVRAVEDGDAYFCRNCLGDGGNGVFIFHSGGYMTLYWHLK